MQNDSLRQLRDNVNEFIANPVHGVTESGNEIDSPFPPFLVSLNRARGVALIVMKLRDEHVIAHAALAYAGLAAEDE